MMPNFQADLVEAGKRWYGPWAAQRRWGRRAAGALLVAALIAAVAVIAVLDSGRRVREPAASPTPTPMASALAAPILRARLPDAATGMVGPVVPRGAGSIVTFVPSWCAPCRLSARHLGKRVRDFSTASVPVVGVATQDNRREARLFARSLPFGVRLDADGDLARQFGVKAFPVTIAFSAEGGQVLRRLGRLDDGDIEALLRAASGSQKGRLRDAYAVLAAPRGAADALPTAFDSLPLGTDPEDARRLRGDSEGVELWLVPGERTLCLVSRTADGVGVSCRAAGEAVVTGSGPPFGSIGLNAMGAGGERYGYVVLPDFVHSARLEHRGTVIGSLPVDGNLVITRVRRGDRIRWLDAKGAPHKAYF